MGDFGGGLPPEATTTSPSLSDPSPSTEDVSVLVTGFGPFKTNPINPSFLISSSLPSTLTVPTPISSTPHQVHIYSHPSPIRVSYSAVRLAVPSIIESFKRTHNGRTPDIVVHIGMASTRHYYAVETSARRDGYAVTDVDGQLGHNAGEGPWRQANLPEIFRPGRMATTASSIIPPSTSPQTSTTASTAAPPPSPPALDSRTCSCPLDDTFLKTWRSHLPHATDVRLSHDAGRYLCEFIYYASLAHAYQSGREGSVAFLHVPGWTDENSIERGTDVVVALVKALVECWVDGPKT